MQQGRVKELKSPLAVCANSKAAVKKIRNILMESNSKVNAFKDSRCAMPNFPILDNI
jgi:hypothetical protein